MFARQLVAACAYLSLVRSFVLLTTSRTSIFEKNTGSKSQYMVPEKVVNGDKSIEDSNAYLSSLSSPKITGKEEKRVIVTIMYNSGSVLRTFYLTAAKIIKQSFPDILIEKRVLPAVEGDEKGTFEIQVDGKIVVNNKNRVNSKEVTGSQNVFVSMDTISSMIAKARRRRRPNTVYEMEKVDGMDAAAVRLEMMRQRSNNQSS